VEFKVLGPLEIEVDGKPPTRLGPTLRPILAILLTQAGQVISSGRLIALIWHGAPPAKPDLALRADMFNLRRILQPRRPTRGESVIELRNGGYGLMVPHGLIDADRFLSLHEEGRHAWEQGNARRAAARLRAALDLWRGEVLEDLTELSVVKPFADPLNEERRAVRDLLFEADLKLGRHLEVLTQLAKAVRAEPVNERLRLLLASATYRSGRPDKAADVCREGIELLRKQTGLESPQLQHRLSAILRRANELEPPPVLVMRNPVALSPPPVPSTFTDRDDVLADMIARLQRGWDASEPTIILLSGMGGVGKSTTASCAAARLRGWFPDGVLFLDLGGARATKRPGSAALLADILRALDVSRPPPGLARRRKLMQTVLAGRRLLMILDDAADEAQVHSLLPRHGPCAVIITSRKPLRGNFGFTAKLTELDPAAATELLTKCMAADCLDRPQEVTDITAAIASLCGNLPLALTVTGANLKGKPLGGLERQRRRLAESRLDALRYGDSATGADEGEWHNRDVRLTLDTSYRALSEPEQRAFRLLGALDAPTFAPWTVASLLDCDLSEAEEIADGLLTASLLEASSHEDRRSRNHYRFHVLIRELAAEKATHDAAAPAALLRCLRSYLWVARQAQAVLEPDTKTGTEAPRWATGTHAAAVPEFTDLAGWLSAEREELVAAVRTAYRARHWRLTWQLSAALVPMFDLLALPDDWAATHKLALAAAKRTHDSEGQAWILCGIGLLRRYQGRLKEAADAFAASERIFIARGDRFGQACALRGYGDILIGRSQFPAAITAIKKALRLFRQLGKQAGEADVLASLAEAYGRRAEASGRRSDWRHAIARSSQSVELSRAIGDRRRQASAQRDLGVALRQVGRLGDALASIEDCLGIFNALGDRLGAASALISSGRVYDEEGPTLDRQEAQRRYEQAATILSELPDRRWQAIALFSLGASHLRAGDPEKAKPYLDQAITRLRGIQDRQLRMLMKHERAQALQALAKLKSQGRQAH
jgi:DNA-binding SARP family transcriptional activator